MSTQTHTPKINLTKIHTPPLVRTVTDAGHSLPAGSWLLKSNDLRSLSLWLNLR